MNSGVSEEEGSQSSFQWFWNYNIWRAAGRQAAPSLFPTEWARRLVLRVIFFAASHRQQSPIILKSSTESSVSLAPKSPCPEKARAISEKQCDT